MSTTPNEVLAEAKRLMGQEVELTIRGELRPWVTDNERVVLAAGSLCVSLKPGENPHDCLVSIKPAPLRVIEGELYDIPGVGLCYGESGGHAWSLKLKRSVPAQTMSGVKRVKVVPE